MSPELFAALPFLALSVTAVAVMLLIAVRRDHRLIAAITLAGLLLALIATGATAPPAPVTLTPMFQVDGFTSFFLALIIAVCIAVVLLSYTYLNQMDDGGPVEEYYLLLLLATLGAAALLASMHFASFFLGLETLSIALIGLIAYPVKRARAIEAGLKYLVLAGVSSAFLLFGIALIYLDFGTMSFTALGRIWDTNPPHGDIYALAGFAMLLTGIGFKLSLVPFHMWAPDIYEGAPAPVTGYVAVVSKVAVFALLLRYFALIGGYRFPSLLWAISLLAILSMLAGNLLALLQDNIKRIFAYSSIAHFGYVLVALLAGTPIALQAASYYLTAYAVTTIGAFGVITLLSRPGIGHDADRLESYRGLMWSHPWLAGALTVLLLSLAGLPPTMGFVAEIYVIASGVGMQLLLPLAALIAGSVIGLYYYLRILAVLLSPAPSLASPPATPKTSPTGGAMLGVLVILLFALGIYPAPLISAIQHATAGLARSRAIYLAEDNTAVTQSPGMPRSPGYDQ
ncbi:NADH-quinone oxidoreductase subunit N [Acidocella aquatica]|uniref:NADH-quinone oxidoreductase subunit N n=1 Tax=Acidocella aquatica TaxID=1922313 RepID=A0ABQ6A725_9PROT|nr:NADH-quinone oxidoreductase subunit N [Acidocella aquatica]GLR66003.1 NADH-quinone oxidoreductase subunit N [Acidocella aquatica]